MQVYEPKPKRKKPKRKVNTKFLLVMLIVIAPLIGAYFWFYQKARSPIQNSQDNSTKATASPEESKPKVLKVFTGKEFRDLYNSIAYPNTQMISQDVPITGNQDADQHLRSLALKRGYQPRSAPVIDNLVAVEGGFKLQQKSAVAWQNLKKSASQDGISLGLTAGYRSAQDQNTIFLSRLKNLGIIIPQIATGNFDNQINTLLSKTALPGYSRHHTGYTVDISCLDNPVTFENSICYKWLSANNFKNTKLSGWIPSYPDGAKDQGPDPEAWEFVWVGKESLYQ